MNRSVPHHVQQFGAMRRNGPFMGRSHPEDETVQRNPRLVVAQINLALLGLTGLLLLAYSIMDGELHYLPFICVSIWCFIVQFLVRKKKIARSRWLRNKKWQEALVGIFSVMVMSSLLVGPAMWVISNLN